MRQKIVITLLTILFACVVTACKSDAENIAENSEMSAKDVFQENQGIVETDQTLARIDGFGEGMRMANEQLANSFRVLAGKEQVDYSKKEYAKSNVAVIRKPWEWQKSRSRYTDRCKNYCNMRFD